MKNDPNVLAMQTADSTHNAGVPATATSAPAAGASPDARSGEYVPVQAGVETHSGEVLLVEAYAVLWVILMAWIFLLWRKQSRMHARLDDLEKILDAAAAKQSAPKS